MDGRNPYGWGCVVCVVIAVLCGVAFGQYGGGSGTADDPYLIYTAEEMNAIGAEPNDWDKHFLLMVDIDLSGYTGTAFNIIGTNREHPFRGVFDGGGHTISNFTYTCDDEDYIGLFGYIWYDPNAAIRNLGLVTPRIHAGSGNNVGALVGYLEGGTVRNCYVEGGTVAGQNHVGGLIGSIGRGMRRPRFDRDGFDPDDSAVRDCHSTCDVVGTSSVGGLVGSSNDPVADSYSTGMVTGEEMVGGLVGDGAAMRGCYADGIVRGSRYVGGLIGSYGSATNCYAQGVVIGNEWVGGLAGYYGSQTNCYATAVVVGDAYTGGLTGGGKDDYVVASFWDVETSRQQSSASGVGKSTRQMQRIGTYRAWGEGDSAGVWTIDDGKDYPRLAWEGRAGVLIAAVSMADVAGAGTADDPYLIYRAAELEAIAGEPNEWGKHFKLMADIDLMAYPGVDFNGGPDGWYTFTGVFDGNGHTISNFTYRSEEWGSAGFFGIVVDPCAQRRRGGAECDPNASPAAIKNLGLLHPVVDGRPANCGGALVGRLEQGTISNCYVEGGLVLGRHGAEGTGGLVGQSGGEVVNCYSTGTVIAPSAGGLVGANWGQVAECYSRSTVRGDYVGGLVAGNAGVVTNCYSRGEVGGTWNAGGLVASGTGLVTYCYSASVVTGQDIVGGLIGRNDGGEVVGSFWDAEMSAATAGTGVGLTTEEMMAVSTFLDAGWDFVGEVENGVEDVWWIWEGEGYPRLWWERGDESPL